MSIKEWSDERLFVRLLYSKSKKTYWSIIGELHSRPNKAVFDKCIALTNSNVSKERIIGIDILAQLGITSRPFGKKTIELFFDVLEKEKDSTVITSILYAISHNNDRLNQEQITRLISFRTSKNNSIREGLVSSLLGLNNDQAIDTLIELSKDKVSSIRNWATFGIGTQINIDNEKIKKALWNRINDKNQDTKLEAIVGLAQRNETTIKNTIRQELKNGEFGTLLLEAIDLLNCIEFIPLLKHNLELGRNENGIKPESLTDLETLINKLEMGTQNNQDFP